MLRLPENLFLTSTVWMLIFDKTFDFSVILNQVMFKIIVIKLIDFLGLECLICRSFRGILRYFLGVFLRYRRKYRKFVVDSIRRY